MKNLIAFIVALFAGSALAYDVTNTVTIVTNIYNRIGEEHWITNNVKNTHVNYYFTNNVYTVSNRTLLVSQETFVTNTTVNFDVSQQVLGEARSQVALANLAATNAGGYATAAAASATAAQSSAASAEYYAARAHGQVQPVIDEGNRQIARLQGEGNVQVARVGDRGTDVIGDIDERQQWFDDHFGQMVTNVNVTVVTNVAEDAYARLLATNETARASEAETSLLGYATSVSNRLDGRISALENRDYSNTRIVHYGGRMMKHYSMRAEYSGVTFNLCDIYVDPKNHSEGSYKYEYGFSHASGFGVSITSVSKNKNNLAIMRIYFATTAGTSDYTWLDGAADVEVLPEGTSVAAYCDVNLIPGRGSVRLTAYIHYIDDQFVPGEMDYFISSDFNVYDANSNVIDRLVRLSQLSAFSNWVEQTFIHR